MRKSTILILLTCAALLLAGCAAAPAAQSNIDQGSYITGVRLNESGPGSKDTGITIVVESDNMPVGVMLRGASANGSLVAVIKDENGNTAWQSAPGSGMFTVNETVTSLAQGSYSLHTAWDGAVSGTYDLYMVPGAPVSIPTIPPSALISGIGMILVALGYVLYSALRRLGWGYLALGALAWVITVAVKFILAIPFNGLVFNFLTGSLPGALGENLFHLYVGALTGITEVLLVWLWVRYTRGGQVDWKRALAYGIGFGAVEALLLGINSLATVLTAINSPNLLSADVLSSVAQAGNLLFALAPISERIFTVLVHVFCTVLLFYGARTRRPLFFWASFLFKTLLDTMASYAQLHGLDNLGFIWLIEGFVALWGVLSWFGIRWIAARYPPLPVEDTGKKSATDGHG